MTARFTTDAPFLHAAKFHGHASDSAVSSFSPFWPCFRLCGLRVSPVHAELCSISRPSHALCSISRPSHALCSISPSHALCSISRPSHALCSISRPSHALCSISPSHAVYAVSPHPTLYAVSPHPTLYAVSPHHVPRFMQYLPVPRFMQYHLPIMSHALCSISPSHALCSISPSCPTLYAVSPRPTLYAVSPHPTLYYAVSPLLTGLCVMPTRMSTAMSTYRDLCGLSAVQCLVCQCVERRRLCRAGLRVTVCQCKYHPQPQVRFYYGMHPPGLT